MGNGYNNHQNLHLHPKGTFLPMLCSRPSIKDVALPRLQDRSMSFSNDPLSPKISCMGQVKRHNNKIVGFPSSNRITISPSVKYSKLKRIFSGKYNSNNNNNNNLSSSTAASITNGVSFTRRGSGARRGPKIDDSKENSLSVNIEEMDPPLPVIKKVHKAVDGGEVDSIWKRRSGGLALQNLQLQQIQLNRHNFAPTTV